MFFTCTSSLNDNKLKIGIRITFYTFQTESKENDSFSTRFLFSRKIREKGIFPINYDAIIDLAHSLHYEFIN